MTFKSILASICLLASFATFGQTINSAESEVKFATENMGFNTVKGTFHSMIGRVNFDENNPNEGVFEVCIDAATINTGNKMRDKDLKSVDFFYTEVFPSICFKSDSIQRTATGYSATGMLILHGISKKIEIPFTYANNTFTGLLTLNRFDFKIGEDTNTFMVGEEVAIEIICVIFEK